MREFTSRESMQFSGTALSTLKNALELSIQDLENQIATCPDVGLYKDDIEQIEAELLHVRSLHQRFVKKGVK